jgi:type IV pilus assembly protein PilW
MAAIKQQRRRLLDQAGMTLVELMVAMLIALIGMIIIFQVFAFSEGFKRTTTAAGDAQQSGSFSSFTLARSIRIGGSGVSRLAGAWSCPLTVSKAGVVMVGPGAVYPKPFDVAGIPNPLRIVPVAIVNGAGTAADPASDTVLVMGGQHQNIAVPLRVPTEIPPAVPQPNSIKLATTVGINRDSDGNPGTPQTDLDLLLAADPNVPGECRLVQSQTAGTTAAVPVTTINLGGQFNPANGLTAYTDRVTLANIGDGTLTASGDRFQNEGRAPLFKAFAVNDPTVNDNALPQSLVAYDFLLGQRESIADNVVNIQAVYGVTNDPAQNEVTCWAAPTGVWAAAALMASPPDITRIRAVRLAVIARSAQREKATDYSAPAITLFSDITNWCADNGTVTYSPVGPELQHRHRTYDVTIPLRNMLLMKDS